MTTKDYDSRLAFLLFSEQQKGTIPPSLCADMLRMTTQGVTNAGNRGRLKYVKWKGIRHYGITSVQEYRIFFSKKFDTRS